MNAICLFLLALLSLGIIKTTLICTIGILIAILVCKGNKLC